MAGAEGLEPSTKVLETHVLPLHHAPTSAIAHEQNILYRKFIIMSMAFLKLSILGLAGDDEPGGAVGFGFREKLVGALYHLKAVLAQ